MTNNPFGLPETATDRILREERNRAALFREAFGSRGVIEAIKQAKTTREAMRGVDFDAPYRGILDTLESDRVQRDQLRHLTTNAWALSVTETARRLATEDRALLEQQRHLASSVLDTVRAFEANRPLLDSAIAAAGSGASYRRMIADALPRFTIFGAIAERMLMIDTMTLRASVEERETRTAVAARAVLEMQRVAAAIVSADTDAETARLQGSLTDLVVGFFQGLGPNTVPELQRMGLVGFISFLLTLLGAVALIPHQETMSPDTRAAFSSLSHKIDQARGEEREYQAATARSEAALLAQHERAYLSRKATLRDAPSRAGAVVLIAPEGTEVAVEERRDRWRKVLYRDPLSNQLARAWVYATAVVPLAAPLSQSGD